MIISKSNFLLTMQNGRKKTEITSQLLPAPVMCIITCIMAYTVANGRWICRFFKWSFEKIHLKTGKMRKAQVLAPRKKDLCRGLRRFFGGPGGKG